MGVAEAVDQFHPVDMPREVGPAAFGAVMAQKSFYMPQAPLGVIQVDVVHVLIQHGKNL
jgi:hypothetical protein